MDSPLCAPPLQSHRYTAAPRAVLHYFDMITTQYSPQRIPRRDGRLNAGRERWPRDGNAAPAVVRRRCRRSSGS